MYYIDELKNLKVYRNQFLLPRNGTNKKKNNAVLLLTPNYESSKNLINSKLMINRYYHSYYIEKDLSFYINTESGSLLKKDHEEYIHEISELEKEIIFNEGVYSHYNPKIVYSGYKDDIEEARKYVNFERIKSLNKDLCAKVKYPIAVTVLPCNEETSKLRTDGQNIVLFNAYNGDSNSYELYANEEIYTMLIASINKNISIDLLNAAVLVLSNTFNGNKNYISKEEDFQKCGVLAEEIEILLQEDKGYSKLYKILKDNDKKALLKRRVNRLKENIDDYGILSEDALDPITKLKRNITYQNNKGSKHILNKITRNIEKTVDPNEDTPNFGVEDGETANTVVPTPEEIKNKIGDAIGEFAIDEDYYIVENSNWIVNPIDEECIITEDYIQTQDSITYLNEASEGERLRKILYKERIRTNKQVFAMYNQIKIDCPDIKFTHIDYSKYKQKNLIVDLRYYNELFFKNNMYKMQKGLDLYFNLLSRMINDNRLTEAGYDKKRVVLIPIKDWDTNPDTKMWLYNKDINPISMIYRLMVKNVELLKETFGSTLFVFMTDDKYFTLNFNNIDAKSKDRFLVLFKKLRDSEVLTADDMGEESVGNKTDSKKAIVDTIVDRIEDNKNIKISHLTGDAAAKKAPTSKTKSETISSNDVVNSNKGNKKEEDNMIESQKKELVEKIEKAATNTNSIDTTLDILDKDEDFKKLLASLDSEEGNNGVVINQSRKNRMDKLSDEVLTKQVKGKTVKEMIEVKDSYSNASLDKKSIPVNSINPEWKELSFQTIAEVYDPNVDIVAMLTDLSKKTYPVSIRDIQVEDTSTTEDYLYTYTVDMENHSGKRFKFRFDIPIIRENMYMKLRGNKKVISGQLFLIPVLKTDTDTAQIISNYNKIFIRRYNTAQGKSFVLADKLIKCLNKNTYKNITVTTGSNNLVNDKFSDIPIDYLDLSSCYTYIETPLFKFYFNQKELRDEYKNKIDLNKGIPIGVFKQDNNIIYYNKSVATIFTSSLVDMLVDANNDILEDINKAAMSTRYTYSKASILSTEIPVVVLTAYSVGLVEVLETANIKYEFTEKRPSAGEVNNGSLDFIKFKDGYLVYTNTYEASMLLNGLKECDTANYSITEINSRSMYLDFLDQFGGRLKSDGIDNFYDCMIDPITAEILRKYKLPEDYISLLIKASDLLVDNSYFSHGNMSVKRLRRNELIAGYFYKALSSSYGQYAISMRHGRDTIMTIKQSAVIDLVLLDPTSSDTSNLNALSEAESYMTYTPKGLSGMNSDRSYSLDKRSFDDSMINILSMSTGFAGNVGITRQATINASVDTVRGYVKDTNNDEMNSINTLCITEALNVMGTTRDDPFRTAMTFVQTSKHSIRTKYSDPALVTNGAGQALPYLTSNTFAFKSKDKGKVVELVEDDYMIIQYIDGTNEYIDLSEKVEKNSSSGYYQIIKLDTDLKLNSSVSKDQIVAYDKLSYNNKVGIDDNYDYLIGVNTLCAMIDTDEGYEDSACISEDLSEAMASEIVVEKNLNIPKDSNIFNLLAEGTPVQEGDIILTLQSPFEDEAEANLLKNLTDDQDEINELGRVNVRSKVTGYIQKIEVYRTVELEELSPTLQKLCKQYSAKVKSKKALLQKYGIDNTIDVGADYKLNATGKLKDASDGVKIIIYMKYLDKLAIGDKVVYWSANKGVVKYVFPKGKEPYALSNKDEKINTMLSIAAANGRMVTSIQNVGCLNRLIMEETRKIKKIAGMDYTIDIMSDR